MMKTNKLLLMLMLVIGIAQADAQGWEPVAAYPGGPTDGAFTFKINNTVFLGSGAAGTGFYAYDAGSDQWLAKADVPSPGNMLGWAFSFSVNGKGYIVGGSYATASDLTNKTWEYDPVSDTWTEKAVFPGGNRDGGCSFSIGNMGYVGCGFDGSVLRNDFYKYDPANDEWTKLDDYPGGAVIFPAAFVIGQQGFVGTGDAGSSETSQFWRYDPSTGTWDRRADFSGSKRQTAVAFSIGNTGFVGGGMSAYNTIRKDFWRYDPDNDQWTLVADAGFPTDTLAWSTAFVLGNMVYVGTGVDLPDFNFSDQFYRRSFTVTGSIAAGLFDQGIEIYPNPAGETIRINPGPGVEITAITLYDPAGKRVRSFAGDLKSLNVSDIASGCYHLQVITSIGGLSRMIAIR